MRLRPRHNPAGALAILESKTTNKSRIMFENIIY